MKIKDITAREILNAKGNPAVEATVVLQDGSTGIASCPQGTSVGSYEAAEVRDHDMTRFYGNGMLKAVNTVTHVIAKDLIGMDATKQREIDKRMIELDGTQNKSKLGVNAILPVSMAVAKAASASEHLPLFRYLHSFLGEKSVAEKMPTPLFNIVNGGAHAMNTFDFQEFIIIPATFKTFEQCIHMGTGLYHALRDFLLSNGLSTLVGDEGGFAPVLSTNYDGLSLLTQAIETTNRRIGFDVFFGIDAASNNFYRDRVYHIKDRGSELTAKAMNDFYETLLKEFKILYLEDILSEDDWDGWKDAMSRLAEGALIVGDDLVATNPYRLQMAINKQAINAVVVKPNQIGTVIESLALVDVARAAGLKVIVSHRSGETNDDFIADFAVAVAADYAKFGAPARGERIAKYNRLLAIASLLER
ncbi:MAG TPA: phosphopyruvate hydratase [Patescibacteria group bacterium]|nr:phosphopyruvate hydratase [Patescibacteria group bacterium]